MTAIETKISDILSQMTLEEKISMCHANSKFTVAAIHRLGIPTLKMSDGPHGVREEISEDGWFSAGHTDDFSTYLPTLTAVAATFNTEMASLHGKVLGSEARARGKDIILGPGVNIARLPVCGRTFEYMGEDPFLSSRIAVAEIKAIQQQGTAACVKHFALNSQELNRKGVNATPDERTLREIYLPAFEAAVKEAGVWTVMGAYNSFRGTNCNQSSYLVQTILKGQWGFKGLLMSDWDCNLDTIDAAMNGLDIEMGTNVPSFDDYKFAKPLLEAVKSGRVPESVINDKVRRTLRVMITMGMLESKRKQGEINTEQHKLIAAKIASEAIVLLKNDNNVLPINRKNALNILVTGPNADIKHGNGGGSSEIKSLYEVTPLEGILNKKVKAANVDHKPFDANTTPDEQKEILAAAQSYDAVIYFGGLSHKFDNENFDKPDMKLPDNQDEFIAKLLDANPNTIIFMIAGSPVEMPWADQAKCIVWGWYAGQEAGNAFADMIFGNENPSGKMPFTLPAKLTDSPAIALNDYNSQTCEYKEGVFTGYRWFEKKNIKPLFAFGHGLSYTSFRYDNLEITRQKDNVVVDFEVTNTGNIAGAEVTQLYIQDVKASVERPIKELKGFARVFLEPKHSTLVQLTLDKRAFSFWDIESNDWKLEAGTFKIMVGSSSEDIRLSVNLEL